MRTQDHASDRVGHDAASDEHLLSRDNPRRRREPRNDREDEERLDESNTASPRRRARSV
jgi:hypothetical protein